MLVADIPRSVSDLSRPAFVRSSPPPWVDLARPPFNVTRVTLRPGETTTAHNHHDNEVWIILAGRGVVRSDDTEEPVSAGDTVYLPPLETHTLHNAATDEPLTFLSVWWEDMRSLAETHTARTTSAAPDERPVLLLPSFPTPNGELHLGHLAGPYLGADIARRSLRSAGTPAHLLLGTVGHQSQVAVAAAAAGLSFHALAERNTDAIMEGLAAADIQWDVFVRPSSPVYPGLARQVFERLRDDGVVVRRTADTNHCPRCDRFLFEAFVSGACPHCGSRDTAGIECEACALPFADADLVDVTCATCGTDAQRKPLTRYFLPLEPLRERLTGYLRTARMSARLAAYVDRVLAGPLPDMPVSIVADDGIEIPDTGGQRMYSAFELAARYLTAVDELARGQGEAGWESYLATHRPRTVLFFGFDNAYLRTIVFPVVLGAFTDVAPLPEVLVSNEFYQLDGVKFSTGRRHAIWGRDAFTDKSRDRLRFYLAATRPESRRSSFSTADYEAFTHKHLVTRLDGWLDAVGARASKHFAGVAPEAGSWNPEAEEFYGRIRGLHAETAATLGLARFSPATAAAAILSFLDPARRFGETAEDILGAPALTGQGRTCMALELMAVQTVAAALRPLIPATADRLAAQIGGITPAEHPQWVKPGTPISVSALFS